MHTASRQIHVQVITDLPSRPEQTARMPKKHKYPHRRPPPAHNVYNSLHRHRHLLSLALPALIPDCRRQRMRCMGGLVTSRYSWWEWTIFRGVSGINPTCHSSRLFIYSIYTISYLLYIVFICSPHTSPIRSAQGSLPFGGPRLRDSSDTDPSPGQDEASQLRGS